jgi:ribosomal protein S18 acetylase RimI-like enzyme
MVIRPATCQDKNEILGLLRQRGAFTERENEVAMQVFEDACSYPEREEYLVFCAADTSDDLMGYICFGPITITDGCYDLYWIAVDETCSRRGIGKKLLAFMEQYVAERGARRVYVETSSTRPYEMARSFYRRNHYDLVCELQDFYREGDHKLIFTKEVRSLVSPNVEAEFTEPDICVNRQGLSCPSGALP